MNLAAAAGVGRETAADGLKIGARRHPDREMSRDQ